jgi:hypothetical protein
VVADDAHFGLFSRCASTSTIQSVLVPELRQAESEPVVPARPVYSLDSDTSIAPERRLGLCASFGISAAMTTETMLALGQPTLPLSSWHGSTAMDPSQLSLLQHAQYVRAQALCRVEHSRQIIADLRASLPRPTNTTSLSGNSNSGSTADGSQDRLLHLSARLASSEMTYVDAIPMNLPVIFASSTDSLVLTGHQALLRQQIELFRATPDDLSSRIRGRNRRIELGQVGIRCRHCAHIPAKHRTKGSVYFPATILGLYQAAQNMSSNHIQCGLCPEMPQSLKDKFTELFPTKIQSSGVGQS